MERFDVSKVISYLKNNTSVQAVLGNRIYSSEITSDPGGIYLIINEITEDRSTVDGQSRVEFRFCANEKGVLKSTLKNAEDVITRLICEKGAIDFSGFKSINVTIQNNIFSSFDENLHRVYIRDYIFTYFS